MCKKKRKWITFIEDIARTTVFATQGLVTFLKTGGDTFILTLEKGKQDFFLEGWG